jgi:signal transduction histidine kinase/CheY-like chemotaxis protein/integral membrane sensor domain MASE1
MADWLDEALQFVEASPMHVLLHPAVATILIGVAYYLAARLGLLLQVQPENIAVFWPASGLAAGVLIALGRPYRASVGIGVMAATVVANFVHGATWATAVAFGLCNTIECLLVAALIERFYEKRFQIDTLSNFSGFVVTAALATTVAALPAALALQYVVGVPKDLMTLWGVWLASDLLGIVTVTPLIIALPSVLREPPSRRSILEGVLLLSLVGAGAAFVYRFDAGLGISSGATPSALLLPFLLLLAARAHPIFSAVGSFVIAYVIVSTVPHGFGPFGDPTRPTSDRVAAAQLAMMTMSLSALALAALLAQQRRTASALHASEQRLRIASTAAGLGVFEWRSEGDTAVWENDRMYEIFERTRWQGAIGADEFFERHVHPDDRDTVNAAAERGIQSGQLRVECRLQLSGGASKHIEIIGALDRDPGGALRGMIGVVIDITQRKRSAEALLEADRRKDEFLAVLGHELRNGLTPLRASVDLLDKADADPARIARVRRLVDEQVRYLMRLVSDLLDVSRISHGRFEIHKIRFDLREAIGSAVEMCRPAIEARRHELRFDLPIMPLPVDGDGTRLAQAIANLLTNAAKYTDAGGSLQIAAAIEDDEVAVRVRDNGIGIAPDFLPRIFDPFEQSADARVRADGGLGIGLMLVRQIAEMHGGSIEARSDGRGRGSEFVLRLPLVQAPLAIDEKLDDGTTRHIASNRAAGPKRILVVDDHAGIREALVELMRLEGHVVDSASDGPDALATAATFGPDVVLLDMRLPGMGGEEVAQKLRGEPALRDALVIGLTGEARLDAPGSTPPSGIDHILVKPASVADIEALMRAPRRQRARENA